MSSWRAAGLSYLQYVEACSQAVRLSLKEPLRTVALRRGENGVKMAKWVEGKQMDSKFVTTQPKA